MRTGADYREALRDGRKVWVMGEGRVADVTTHPATSAMVEEYVAWYDRHFDPAWQDTLIAPATAGREPTAWAYLAAEDLRGSDRHGPVLRQDDLPQRRQHHPYPGLRPSDLARRLDRGAAAECLAAADRRCGGLSRADRRDRAVSDLLRRRRPARLPACAPTRASGPRSSGARNRCRGRAQRQARHAYEPGLCRGRLCRRAQRDRDRRTPRQLRRAGRRAGGDDCVPQDRGARREPVRRTAVTALRRARRPDVARGCVHPVGARVLSSSRRPSRSPLGSYGITSMAGSPRPSSPSASRSPSRMRWG